MKKYMKFLFIAPRFHTNQHFWVKMLLDRGHEVRFWVWRKEITENYTIITPDFIDPLFGKRRDMTKEKITWEFPNPVRMWRKMCVFNPDIVIVRDPMSYLFVFIGMLISRFQGRKVVIYSQTPLHKSVSLARGIVVRIIMTLFANSWITPVLGDIGKFRKFHPRAFYVPLAVEPLQVKHTIENMLRVLCVGKLYLPKKRHLLLLEAIKDLKNVQVTFIGFLGSRNPEYLSLMKEYIAKNELTERVKIIADISHQDTLQEYGKYDVFILAGSEPLAYSVLEAIAAGLPVICSVGNGARWYVEEGRNGYVFREDSAPDLREKIRMLDTDRTLLARMQVESKRLADSTYTPDAIYPKMMEAVYG
ncbi:hypothetical protein A3A03_02915 [Candidatus Nomurabacteria bacterium RIFCSPLOWO2_01_FULL_40_18]|uniref:Glycosyl transferase family 1 domain-containing protein n=1 Tax=Candidatus Nomurabacteria bacterium RIFCSPLOWO2_01_FULL_40_18 TaxID=1801773 RepID=A0A1F6XK35_9BACT|nr:MAG: hypothetical protein A3A03_02915 [Candidatus Nomurabacteria bacterium RIFCSPLOWO2_01_FULL_40_18]